MSVNKVNSDGSLSRVAGGTLYADAPIGTISPFGGSTVPNGYLLCNGAEVLKTAYAELYTAIGDAFGTASDNTKFVLPDLREAVPVGVGTRGNGVAEHDAYAVGEFKDDQLQTHNHGTVKVNGLETFGVTYDPSWSESATYAASLTGSSNNTISLSVGGNSGRSGTTTHGKQLGVNYIIKAKQVAVPFDMAEYVRNQNVLSDYETASSSFTAEYDGFISAQVSGTGLSVEIKINGASIARNSNADYGVNGISALFKKGDVVLTNDPAPKVCYYKLRDYTGR